MKYTIETDEKFTVLRLGEQKLNTSFAPSLKLKFVTLKNEGVNNLILDLQEVEFVDSSGLSAILTANRVFNEEGSFVLTGIVHELVEKLINISRLDSILTIIPTVSESIDYVMMVEVQRELEDARENEEA